MAEQSLNNNNNKKNNKTMKQLKINSAAEKFVSRDELNKYIKTSIVNVVSKKGNKYAYALKIGNLKEYAVLQVNTDYVNGQCNYDSLFEYYDVYLFGANSNTKLTNINNNSIEDEFIDAIKSKKQIVIAKERNNDVSYIIEANKGLGSDYRVKGLDENIGTNASIKWIFENLDVFVLDI